MLICSLVLLVIGVALAIGALSSSFVLRGEDMPGGLIVLGGMLMVLPLAIYSCFSPSNAGRLVMVSMACSFLGVFLSPGEYAHIRDHALIMLLILSPAFIVGWLLERFGRRLTGDKCGSDNATP
jgi:hypothetical protein